MNNHFSYQIRHVQLAEPVNLPVLTTSQAGWYLVFWWEEIPLGQLFIEPGETLTEEQLWEKTQSVLWPTIQSYSPDRLSVSMDQNASAAPIQATLTNLLRSVFADFAVKSLPARVPVTVVICTRNRAAQLATALRSLQALPCLPEEIVVVDNAPTDDSTAQVVSQFPGVSYVLEPKAGLDFARNTGIRMAHMPIVAYMDDDVRVHPHWVYQLWQTFETSEAAAMTGLVIATELQTEAQLIFEKHWSFNRGYVDKVYDTAFFDQHLATGPPVWEIGAGANMAFRRSIFDKVGFFDERMGAGASGCSDDSEMWFRILAHGDTILYNPRAISYHEHRKELEALKKQLFSYMRGFTAAALIQQQQYPQARYRRHIFRVLPPYYFLLLRRGFPAFRFRHQTIGVELKGVLSGLLFYFKNRKRPSNTFNQDTLTVG